MSDVCPTCGYRGDCDDCIERAMYPDGRYQAECEDYAVNGNPWRDHIDYEEAAAYDRFDGWGDPDPCAAYDDCDDGIDDPGCPDCGYRGDCPACKAAKRDYAVCAAGDDIPF